MGWAIDPDIGNGQYDRAVRLALNRIRNPAKDYSLYDEARLTCGLARPFLTVIENCHWGLVM
jgi:hypothetical protein